ILLLALAFGVRANHLPAVYFTNTNVDLNNRLIYGELVYDVSDLCGRYALRFKTKAFRNGSFIDSARVVFGVNSSVVLSNTDRYTLVGDTSIAHLSASGLKLRAGLPSGVQPTDSVALVVEVYKVADACVGCGVGSSDFTFIRRDIWAACPFPDKESSTALLSCTKAASGSGARWEAFIHDERDCKIYRTVYFENSDQWWMGQNLDWRGAGKCYSTASSCDTSGACRLSCAPRAA
ncbi:MAG: hypothetical protein LBK47_05575, partial [Prevotellaceae bacterium]|nr:hypothetical protein [Prevotellaceae bacterium]